MAKSYFHDGTDWRELVKGEQGERGPVGPRGPQGPAIDIETGLPISVDTTVGTRVFVGDTMIHGDTGWRDILHLVDPNVLTPDVVSVPRCYLCRVNSTVSLVMRLSISPTLVGTQRNATLSPIDQLPSGFRQTPVSYGTLGMTPISSGGVAEIFNLSGNRYLNLRGDSGVWESGDSMTFTASWQTTQDWPTSLPGTPA